MWRGLVSVFIFLVGMTVAASPQKKRLLLITESRGYIHDVVNRVNGTESLVERTFLDLAKNSGRFGVDISQDSQTVINHEGLKKYDAIFFFTSGELPLSNEQKAALLSFVRDGKGFGGCHSATDTFYKWKEYGELVGAYMNGHPWHQKVRISIVDKKHPATRHFGNSFEITDEIYEFPVVYLRKLKVLMKLDMRSVSTPGYRKDPNNPLAWTRRYGKGRVFYTALGHREEVWKDPRFQQHLLGGLEYLFRSN